MKEIKIFSAPLLISTILFFGCQKVDNNVNIAQRTTDPNANITPNGYINYQLMTISKEQNSPIYWDSGYINATMLTFNGTHIDGNALHEVVFNSNIQQTTPLFKTINLGSVSVGSSMFNYASFSVTLNSNQGSHALLLNGIYRFVDQYYPVELIIDQQELLSSVWIDTVTIAPGDVYNATIYFDLSRLNDSLTSSELLDASRVNNEIVISANLNINLYNIILNNLTAGLTVQFLQNNVINQNTDTLRAASLPNPAY